MARAWLSQAEDAAQHQNRLEDLVERALVAAEHRDAGLDQLRADLRLEVREGQHQIGLEVEDAIGAKRGEAADLQLSSSLGRAMRGAGNADHALAGTEGIADLDVLGRQADDAPGKVGRRLAIHAALTSPRRSARCRATPRWKARYASLVIRGFQLFSMSSRGPRALPTACRSPSARAASPARRTRASGRRWRSRRRGRCRRRRPCTGAAWA